MLVEFSIIPIGKGESLGDEIAKALDTVDKSGLPYRATPMSTIIEGEWDEVMDLINRCHREVLATAPRVVTTISIDDRPSGPPGRITSKLASVEERLGREVRK